MVGPIIDAVSVFDPEPLKQIAATLATQVPAADPSKFDAIWHQLTAVDGSVFKTAVRVASLAWLPNKAAGTTPGKTVDGYRMHTHFEILRGVPERIDATPAKPKGKDDEKAVLASVLQPDRCYTGGQPNKRTYEMICFYLLELSDGSRIWARLEELEAHIEKLKQKPA